MYHEQSVPHACAMYRREPFIFRENCPRSSLSPFSFRLQNIPQIFGRPSWTPSNCQYPLEHRNEGKIPRQHRRDSTTNAQNSTKKDEMCRRAQHGRCKFGKECWYKHPMCENAIKGECRFGVKCWHEHPTSVSKQAQSANQTHQPNTLDTKNPEQRNKASDDETHFLYLALQKLIDRR